MVLGNVKRVLANVFRIALTAQSRPEEAVRAFDSILDDLMVEESREAIQLAEAVAAAIDISSISGDSATSDVVDTEPHVPANSPSGPVVSVGPTENIIELKVEEAPIAIVSEVVPSDDDRLSSNQLEEDDADSGDDADEEDADDDEATSSDSYLERLEVVRIRKVLYWKDTETGDLYAYMPEDEVGDKVGKIEDGKPTFY